PGRPRVRGPLPLGRVSATREPEVPAVAVELAERFAKRGHEVALVGGSVRDALMRRLGDDIDLATSARPDEVLDAVSGWADATWEVGIAFGTVGVQKGDHRIEVTTYRSESYDAS